jgi:hypothetical protein
MRAHALASSAVALSLIALASNLLLLWHGRRGVHVCEASVCVYSAYHVL